MTSLSDEINHLMQISADLDDPIFHFHIAEENIEHTRDQLQGVIGDVHTLGALNELITFTLDSMKEPVAQVQRLRAKIASIIDDLRRAGG